MSKPLISRLLLENSNRLEHPALGTSGELHTPNWHESQSLVQWQTPTKSDDIRQYVKEITRLRATHVSTIRTLFKKVAKGVEKKDFIITQQEQRIRQLESKVL